MKNKEATIKKILSAVSKLSLTSAVNLLTGLIRVKIFALFLDPKGFGLISQILNFQNLIVFIISFGIPLGLTKFIAENKSSDFKKIYSVTSQILFIGIFVSILILITSFFVSDRISLYLFNDNQYSKLVIIVLFSMPFVYLYTLFDSFLKGLQEFKKYTTISIIVYLVGFILNCLFCFFWGIDGVIYAILLNSILSILMLLIYLRKKNILNFRLFTFNFHFTSEIKIILKLGGVSLLIGILDQVTSLIIRSLIVRELGLESNGIFQTVYSVSFNAFNIFYLVMGVYYLPSLSSLNSASEIIDEINNVLRISLLFATPVITILFVFRHFLIVTLYSQNFLMAKNLFSFYLAGDFLKIISWIIGMYLIVALQSKTWILIDIIFSIIYLGSFSVLLYFFQLDLYSVVISYCMAYLIKTLLVYMFVKKRIRFSLSASNAKLVLTSILMLICTFGFSILFEEFSYFFFIFSLICWAFWVIEREEANSIMNKIRRNFS